MNAQCPNCQTQFAITEPMFGQNVKCGCGTVMKMPAAPAAAPAPAVAPAAPPTAAAASGKIQFQCNGCGKAFSVAASAAGKVAKCGCGAKTQVPGPSPANPAPANPGSFTPNPGAYADPNAIADPFADPYAAQPSAPSQDDPLGLGGIQNYGTDLPTHHPQAAMNAPPPPGPRPKPKRMPSQQKQEAGVARLLGFGQAILGLLLLLAAVGLFIASFQAEQVKGRSYKGMIVLAIFGIGLMGSGANALFNSE